MALKAGSRLLVLRASPSMKSRRILDQDRRGRGSLIVRILHADFGECIDEDLLEVGRSRD